MISALPCSLQKYSQKLRYRNNLNVHQEMYGIKVTWYRYTMGCYSGMRKKEIWLFVSITWAYAKYLALYQPHSVRCLLNKNNIWKFYHKFFLAHTDDKVVSCMQIKFTNPHGLCFYSSKKFPNYICPGQSF